MKKYLSFFRMRFLMGLQYRAAAAAGVVTQFTWGFMELLVFRAFYQADASAFPMSFEAVASYIWLQQAFLALFMAWMMEAEIFSSIVDGNIAYEMCRPVHIYSMWFARSVANRVSKALLRCAPILVVALFLPKPYRLILPQDPMTLFLFLLTMILGTLVTVAIGVIIYTSCCFTISAQGIRIFYASACELLSGQIVPLPYYARGGTACVKGASVCCYAECAISYLFRRFIRPRHGRGDFSSNFLADCSCRWRLDVC